MIGAAYVLGYKIDAVNLPFDPLLWPVLKESPSQDSEKEIARIKDRLLGSQIQGVGRHGKYFWLRLRPLETVKSNVLLMHFGMTGMIKIKNVKSHLVFMENGGDKKFLAKEDDKKADAEVQAQAQTQKVESDKDWPPRFTKFDLQLVKQGGEATLEVAFVDPRRLARIRLIDDERAQTDEGLLQTPPLNLLGPDYSKSPKFIKSHSKFVFGDPDPDNHGRPRLNIHDFNKLVLSRKKAIKSLLLDQAFFAGVGNWVADEVLFHAKVHPNEVLSSEIQYKSGLIHPVIQRLYDSLIYVCEESVKVEGSVRHFPEHWLMRHRWGKARKKQGPSRTHEGFVLDHITVGGRTSCFAPEVQKLLKSEETVKQEPKKRIKQSKNKQVEDDDTEIKCGAKRKRQGKTVTHTAASENEVKRTKRTKKASEDGNRSDRPIRISPRRRVIK
ncbi:hypothetical protein KGF56_002982 [Candida oxycetoniae]|uniref:Formamidopyrimidine-DNA glycosylase catalytic domain-containing protein n=1 Tax=Candida oxycetoniae TaxID=497107 RepID=A0AAI9SWW2_9ASCO|nr:uncharacterized protein KGF56_002982 [Candida oxycetoniae]KAI3404221.2 hypothetical protein KGF56_002982 [Candida oxycetoniae]